MKKSDIKLALLRMGMGWLFLYAGWTKVVNPGWSAAGYLKGAKTFSGLYQWLASSANIEWINFLNQWGLVLIGVALILGVVVKLASFFGAVLMILYYFPILTFPMVGKHSYIVDEHIIYVLVFLLFMHTDAGKVWGLGKWFKRLPGVKGSCLAKM